MISAWGRAVVYLAIFLSAAVLPAAATVTLTGNYIQLPIDSTSQRGRFMAEGDIQGAKFNSAGTSGALGVDFWQAGTPVYNYTIASAGAVRTNGVGWFSSPVVTDTSSGSMNSATIVGTPFAGLNFTRSVSFADSDQVIVITDTLTNTGLGAIGNIATLDNTDPDQSQFTTRNDVIGRAVFAQATVGTLTLAFVSTSPLAVASASGFSNTDPYAIISAPEDPNGAANDIGINLAMAYGSLTPGQSVSVTWYIVFGSDLATARSNACGVAGGGDGDGDGICDVLDNCPAAANAGQIDSDGDGFGDVCDPCVGIGNSDADGDAVCDGADNCPMVANTLQIDSDGDGFGNACDSCTGPGTLDSDLDGACDGNDNCPSTANPSQRDCDLDSLGDACDPDTVDADGDGVADACDNCADPNPSQADFNGDGLGDDCEQGQLDTTGCYRASDTLGPPDGTEPEFLFINISTTGTSVDIGSHQVSTAIPLGFTFEYYGQAYSQIFVSSNGFLTFLAGQGEGCCGGFDLPDTDLPNGLVTGLWAHLHPSFGSIFRETIGFAPNRAFVLQFNAVSNTNTSTPDTWEVILYEGSNEIVVQYASAHSGFVSTTAGIENGLGTIGLRWAGPGPVNLVNEAVRYAPTTALSTDGDGDGSADCVDNCPLIANPGQEDTDENGIGDACNDGEDVDGDEWADTRDNCPNDPNPTQVDNDFDGFGDACDTCFGFGASDVDSDGFCDVEDNCPLVANPSQSNTDFDSFGDACDFCVGPGAIDTDGDLVCDPVDNCPNASNPSQINCDGDALGDACDPDAVDGDADGVADACDNCPAVVNPTQANCDGDGLGDLCDPDTFDTDGDGIADACDSCPTVVNPAQADLNGDGRGDDCTQGILDTDTCYRASDTLGPPDGTEPEALFIDVSTTGTAVSVSSHTVSPPVPIGFTFEFYGQSYSQLFVSANGFLTFLSGQGEGCCGGSTLPLSGVPNGLIAGLWNHIHPNFGSVIRRTIGTAPNRQFILMFKEVASAVGGPNQTWEIILYEGTNEIVVQYANAQASNVTAGIENAFGTVGLRWAGPGPVQLINQAVRYSPAVGLAVDDDGDGRGNCIDNCPAVANPGQEDADNDGTGDACNDAQDGDGDEWADALDNCPGTPNPTQADSDFDGAGDACDLCFGFGSDFDADGICDGSDNCVVVPNPSQSDCDGDLIGDACDLDGGDSDGDDLADGCDPCPLDAVNSCASLLACTSGSSVLYRINALSGVAAPVGPMGISDCGGLARDPASGTVYAAARNVGNAEEALWTVDVATGSATLVGSMGVPAGNTDLAFRSDGALFSIHTTGAAIVVGSVNKASGVATILGSSGTAGTGNGITFDTDDRLLHGNNFTLNELSQSTGTALPLASLLFPPLGCTTPRLTALAETGDGELFGTMACAAGSPTYLVTVNPTSGVVTNRGETANNIDGLAFVPTCGDGIVDVDEECDDGNASNGDCCSSACEMEPDGSSCSDGFFCNGAETCTGGVCGLGTTPCVAGCDEQADTCTPCALMAQTCRAAASSSLIIKDKDNDGRDKLIWKWRKGAATSASEYGNPTATTDYALCLYRANGTALIGSVALPADPSKWSANGSDGFLYRDRTGTARRALVMAGGEGESKALAVGKGSGLPDLALPLAASNFPLVAQLQNTENAVCWEGRYQNPTNVISNEAGLLKLRVK